jgi:hypothetical protein
MQRLRSITSHVDLRPGGNQFYLAMLPLLLLAYGLAFTVTFGIGLAQALLYAIVPMTGVAIMAVPTRALLLHQLFRLPPAPQALAQALAALVFAILLYWLRTVFNGVVLSGNPINFRLPDFFAPGAGWMLIEGIMLYALLALAAYVEVLRARLAAVSARAGEVIEQPCDADAPFRLFVKHDDEFRPIDPARIILARGADDYAELVTGAGTHLVRMTLSTLSERLGARFIRVHRSWLVNVERIGKAEPAGGGRMLLHMENGAMITTSRAGARLLRERIV